MKYLALPLALLVGCATLKPANNEYKHFQLPEGKTLSMHSSVANALVYLYDDNPRELPLCLLGHRTASTYSLDGTELPVYIESEPDHAKFNTTRCKKKNYIGIAHNHTDGDCNASKVDADRFLGDNRAEVELIVCDADRHDGTISFTAYVKTQLPQAEPDNDQLPTRGKQGISG